MCPRKGRPATRYAQILTYVRAQISETGRAPSYGQICRALGIGDRSSVRKLVLYGERRGHMLRTKAGLVLKDGDSPHPRTSIASAMAGNSASIGTGTLADT
jgi:hypothetical protein